MAIAPFPIVLPLFMAAVLAALEHIPSRQRALDVLGLATALAVAVLDLLLLKASLARTIVYWVGGWTPMHGFPVGIALVVDPASAFLACCSAVLATAALLFSSHHFRAVRTYYHTLMLLFLASLQGFCLTGDLFNMFVFFELMGVAAYALTGYKIEESGPLEGALNFAVMNSVGGIMVLLGIALVYALTGGLNLAWAGAALEARPTAPAVPVAFMLLAVGFLVKGAVVPFHFWLPDAHAVAPTPASVLFSGIMVQVGLYAVARIYWVVFSGSVAPAPLQFAFIALGVATALLGGVMACLQRHLKRLLAYSTVSHSGLMLCGLAMLDRRALEGTLLYIAGHGFVKGALFVAAGILVYHHRSVDEKDLHGRGRRLRATGILFLVAGLVLAGLPPFGPWAGKGFIEESAKGLGYGWLSGVFMTASALAAGAVLRAGAGIFFGVGEPDPLSNSAPTSGEEGAEASPPTGGTPALMMLPLVLLLLASLVAGALPWLQEISATAAARFVDRHGYRLAVLQGIEPAKPPTSRHEPSGIGTGVATVAGSVAVAAAFLGPGPFPGWTRRRGKALLRPTVLLLRRVHSGYIGDYVTWFMAGSALMLLLALLRL
jgi:multicomponent Na+:H+ antiporter subunit D